MTPLNNVRPVAGPTYPFGRLGLLASRSSSNGARSGGKSGTAAPRAAPFARLNCARSAIPYAAPKMSAAICSGSPPVSSPPCWAARTRPVTTASAWRTSDPSGVSSRLTSSRKR